MVTILRRFIVVFNTEGSINLWKGLDGLSLALSSNSSFFIFWCSLGSFFAESGCVGVVPKIKVKCFFTRIGRV